MATDWQRWAAYWLVLSLLGGAAACGSKSKDTDPGTGGSITDGGVGPGGSDTGTGGLSTGGTVVIVQGGSGNESTGGTEPTDPCLLATCNPGQRCEVEEDSASCVDNDCSDLDCSETERCEPHALGGNVCVDIGCSSDVDCAAAEYCDDLVCQPDVCEPASRACEADAIVECSSNGGELSAILSCGSSSYFATECVDDGNGDAGCSCEEDWDCPANTFCEVDSCQGTGVVPSCTLPPTPFEQTLPAEEIHWGGESRDNDAAHDGTVEQNPAPWPTHSHVLDTPIVANLDDDNGDGLINELDFPEIIFTSYRGSDPWSEGVVRAIHGGGPRKGADYFARCGDMVWHESEEVGGGGAGGAGSGLPECNDEDSDADPAAPVAVGDLNYDGIPEIVYATENNTARILDNTGELLLDLPRWSSDYSGETIALANLDYDGYVEVIVGRDVYVLGDDGNGGWEVTHHLTGTGATGHNTMSSMVCPADLTDDPGQEFVAGATLYRLPDALPSCDSPPCPGELEVVWDATDAKPEDSALSGDGFCAVSDVWVRGEGSDLGAAPSPGNGPDGIPEVVLIDDGNLIVLGVDGVILHEEYLDGGQRGGAPNVDDFDGDGYMEIASALRDFYVVVDLQTPTNDSGNCPSWPEVIPRDPTASNPNPERTPGGACTSNVECNEGAVCNQQLGQCVCLHNGWRRDSDDNSSRATSSSVFDFNGDGAAEVLYNDECDFRVYDGLTGEVLASEMSRSRTAVENPIVADVDNDGNAEVVTVSNTEQADRCDEDGGNPQGPNGLRVWGDPSDTWVSARRVWNQQSYHVVNVTEGGTIPVHPPESWGSFNDRTYNTYRSQPRSFGVAPDLRVTDVGVFSPDATCGQLSENIDITFVIENEGDLRVGPGVTVGFVGLWGDDEEELLAALGGDRLSLVLTQSIEPGRSTLLSVSYAAANNARGTLPDRVRVIVDVDDIERECDEDDNGLEEDVDPGTERPDLELQLGTARAACPDGVVAVTLRNVGTESVDSVLLSFFAGDPAQGGGLLHSETFEGPLAPGDGQTFDVTISSFPMDRSITIYGVADPDNAVDECNEANNRDPADNPIRCDTRPR